MIRNIPCKKCGTTLRSLLNASKKAILPTFVMFYSPMQFKKIYLKVEIPHGCLRLAHKSENFIIVLIRFVKYILLQIATTKKAVLLLLDNHERHIKIIACTNAYDVVMVTL